MRKLTRRTLLLGSGIAVGATAHKLLQSTPPSGTPLPTEPAGGSIVLNDASLLNPTPVAKHLVLTSNKKADLVTTLRRELAEAKQSRLPFAVGSARHSMGRQSVASGGIAITLDQGWLEPDTEAGIYRVSPGARWSMVIQQLSKLGFSPKVMQSNNDFGIASTFAVNAHGWPVPWGAFGSTVRSIELMLHTGDVVICSRSQNADLFQLAMGGYGLIGTITELTVEMVPDVRLSPTFQVLPGKDLGQAFSDALEADPTINMAYGRMDISLDNFLNEALFVTYRPTEDQEGLDPPGGVGMLSGLTRRLLRGQVNSERMKALRWQVETGIGSTVQSKTVTRNTLINSPVSALADGDQTRTDILHEYFVAPDQFPTFIEICQQVIPSSYQQLLNITLRYVAADDESVLSYAPGPRIAAVMLFSQEMSTRAEEDMARMTSELVGRVLEIGGSYYLPYRLHATDDQFQAAYPRAGEFAAAKRRRDPGLVFSNGLWDRYLSRV